MGVCGVRRYALHAYIGQPFLLHPQPTWWTYLNMTILSLCSGFGRMRCGDRGFRRCGWLSCDRGCGHDPLRRCRPRFRTAPAQTARTPGKAVVPGIRNRFASLEQCAWLALVRARWKGERITTVRRRGTGQRVARSGSRVWVDGFDLRFERPAQWHSFAGGRSGSATRAPTVPGC